MNVNGLNGEVTKYEIFFDIGPTVSSVSTSKTVNGESTTVDLTGLQSETEYTVAVKAYNATGGGPLGNSRNVRTENGEFTSYVYM